MRIRMDANAGEIMDFTPAPEGEALVKVMKAAGTTSQKGHNQVKLECEIEGGPYAGKKVWENITFIPKGQPGHGIALKALKGFGMRHDGVLDFDTDEMIGKIARVYLAVESYVVQKDGPNKGATRYKNVIQQYLTDDVDPPKARGPLGSSTTPSAAPDQEEVPF